MREKTKIHKSKIGKLLALTTEKNKVAEHKKKGECKLKSPYG